MTSRRFVRTVIVLSSAWAAGASFPVAAAPKMPPPPSKKVIKKEFREAIEKHRVDFNRCGEAEAERTKRRVKGILLLKYVVNGDGMVTESGPVHNTTKSRFVADCVVRVVERIRFPATFGAPTTNSHTFKFDEKAPGAATRPKPKAATKKKKAR